jgi:GH43 family beta-xylosidase
VIQDPQYGYHLFYHGGPSTSAARVGHAWSHDGINWERDPVDPVVDLGSTTLPNGEKMPVLTGGPSALYKDGKIYLYFMAAKGAKSGYGTFGAATMHLATADCS